MNSRELGAALLVAGTAIGAGMLAQPIASASIGYLGSLVLLVIMWFFSYLSASNLVDLNEKTHLGITFPALAKLSMGKVGEKLTYVMFALLHYALLSAYTDGLGQSLASLLSSLFDVSVSKFQVSCVVAVFVFLLLAFSTTVADKMNQLLFAGKVAVFILISAVLAPEVNPENLVKVQSVFALTSVPIFFAAFGFQGSIPAVLDYMGKVSGATLKRIMLFGSLAPLVVYGLWQTIILGIIPITGVNSFQTIKSSTQPLAEMMQLLTMSADGSHLDILSHAFTLLAVLTSFIGVGLALFHLIHSSVSNDRDNSSWAQKSLSGLLTFVPPVIVVVLFPQAFIHGLSFAGFILAFIALFVPAVTRITLNKSVDLVSILLLLGFATVVTGETLALLG